MLIIAATSKAKDLRPFDRLGRDNVTLDAKSVANGAATRNEYETDYGSYDKTKDQDKDIAVRVLEVSPSSKKLSIEFYFVFRDARTNKESFVPAVVFKEENGMLIFRERATSTDTKLAMIGVRTKTGESIYGWFVRAVRDGRIVAVAGSAERFVKMAGDPKAFHD